MTKLQTDNAEIIKVLKPLIDNIDSCVPEDASNEVMLIFRDIIDKYNELIEYLKYKKDESDSNSESESENDTYDEFKKEQNPKTKLKCDICRGCYTKSNHATHTKTRKHKIEVAKSLGLYDVSNNKIVHPRDMSINQKLQYEFYHPSTANVRKND